MITLTPQCRASFINAVGNCILEAIPSDYFHHNEQLIIEICSMGQWGSSSNTIRSDKKTLTAEAIINFLSDAIDPVHIPPSDKMRFEKSPSDAIERHAEGKIHSRDGLEVDVSFLRDGTQIKTFGIKSSIDNPRIMIISHKGFSMNGIQPDCRFVFDGNYAPQHEWDAKINFTSNIKSPALAMT